MVWVFTVSCTTGVDGVGVVSGGVGEGVEVLVSGVVAAGTDVSLCAKDTCASENERTTVRVIIFLKKFFIFL